MSRTNETRHIKWHETCKQKCGLDASACNNKQRNKGECRYECKELIDKGVCEKGFIWNPSNCDCECDKRFDVGEYIDYENCKGRKKLVDKLVEECTENIKETKLNETQAKNGHKYSCCKKLCIVLFWIFFIFFVINIGIGTYFTYYKYMNRNKENAPRYDYTYQATIY